MAAMKKTTEASKPTKAEKAKPRWKANAEAMPKLGEVAKAKGKQESVKVARTKNKRNRVLGSSS